MQNKYFKFLIIALAVAVIVPQVALASWWNPFSWGWLNRIFHFQQTEQKQEQTIKQNNKQVDQIAKYSAFVETTNGSNSVTTKIHVKNLQTNEDKIVKTENCCLEGTGCGICPLPCQIKGFSPTEKYLVEDCGTSPSRTVNVINIASGKETTFSAASSYSWSGNEEMTYVEPRDSSEPAGNQCKINVASGTKKCTPQDPTAGWKTYTNTQYGFEIKYPSSWFYKQYSWGPKLSGAFGKGIAFCPVGKYNEQNCTVEPMMNTPVAPIFINTSTEQIISSSLILSEDGQIYKDIYNQMLSTFKFITPTTVGGDKDNTGNLCRVACGGFAMPAGEAEFCGNQKTKETCQNQNHICQWVLNSTPPCPDNVP